MRFHGGRRTRHSGSGIGAIESAATAGRVRSTSITSRTSNLAAAVLQTEQLLNAVHALSAVLLERFEQDGGWAADGVAVRPAWTAQRTGSARAGLRGRRRQGAALTRLPAVSAEARTGRFSTEHLRGHRRLRPPPPRPHRSPRDDLAAAGRGCCMRRASGSPPATGSPRPPTPRPGPAASLRPRVRPGQPACTSPARSRAACGSTGSSPRRRRPGRGRARGRRRRGLASRPRRRPQRHGLGGVGAAGRRPRRPRGADHAPRALRRVRARPLPGRGRRPSTASRPSRRTPPATPAPTAS